MLGQDSIMDWRGLMLGQDSIMDWRGLMLGEDGIMDWRGLMLGQDGIMDWRGLMLGMVRTATITGDTQHTRQVENRRLDHSHRTLPFNSSTFRAAILRTVQPISTGTFCSSFHRGRATSPSFLFSGLYLATG